MNLMPALFAGLNEVRIFREETVSGMDGVRSARARGFKNQWDIEIALGIRAKPKCLIRVENMERLAVDVGVDGNSRDAEFSCASDDAESDLSAICNQDLPDTWHARACYELRSGISRQSPWEDPGALSSDGAQGYLVLSMTMPPGVCWFFLISFALRVAMVLSRH